MEGYPIKLSFFIEGQRTFNTLGISNNIFYDSLSGPMVITTSCLEDLIIPSAERWFCMIIKETECNLNIALKNITDFGASVAFYYDKNWSDDIFLIQNKNIAIDDITYAIVKKNNLIGTVIKSNAQSVLQTAQADMFLLIVIFIIIGFLLHKIGIWTYNKYETYTKNKLCSTYSGNGEEEEICTICIEEFKEGDIIRTLHCNHIFHKKCIDEWFDKKEVCPNCNQPALLTESLLH
ncbi:E3 ubiquitin protein ligase [Flavobacteriaceae bacterium]|nr:E3 ubiquitin protein ligase [Flavobacteriaceae bacterium]